VKQSFIVEIDHPEELQAEDVEDALLEEFGLSPAAITVTKWPSTAVAPEEHP
jgi:hypothetical protein